MRPRRLFMGFRRFRTRVLALREIRTPMFILLYWLYCKVRNDLAIVIQPAGLLGFGSDLSCRFIRPEILISRETT